MGNESSKDPNVYGPVANQGRGPNPEERVMGALAWMLLGVALSMAVAVIVIVVRGGGV